MAELTTAATGPWQAALVQSYEGALDLMRAALHDCPDELWEASMWVVPRPYPWEPLPSPDGTVSDDPTYQERLLQGGSAVWNVAYHALWHLDYDISGGFVRWSPPEPFGDQDGGRVKTRVFTKQELLGYVEFCRSRARETIGRLTDKEARKPLPARHRFRGQSYASLLMGIPRHVTEHGSQIRQFITAAGVEPSAAADARSRAALLRAAVAGASDDEIGEWAEHFGGIGAIVEMVLARLAARPVTGPSWVAFVLGDNLVFEIRSIGGKGGVARATSSDAPAGLRATPADFLRLVVRDLSLEDALATGRIAIDGDVQEVRRVLGLTA
jgi:hypothetical protein